MKTQDDYLVILEQGTHNWGAYCPDVLGCTSTGRDQAETRRNFTEALQGHLDWMQRDGDPPPAPRTETDTVAIALPGHAPRRYLVVLQPTPLGNWSATPADVPDLVLEFATRAEALYLLQAALQSHVEILLANGEPLPEPASEPATTSIRLADALVAA